MPDNGDRPRGLYEAPFKVERPEKASQTLLAHLDRCAYSGALYIRHKGGPQTPAMARGEAFHDFAERATNMLIEQSEAEMPPDVAKELMVAVLEERVDLNVPDREQNACRGMAWNWGASTYLDLESIVGVEAMLEMRVGDWMIRGKLDLCSIRDNEAFVRDYKTSLHVESRDEYEQSFQAQMYGLLMLEGVPEGEDVALGKGLGGVHTRQDYPRYRREEDGELVHRYAYYDRAQMHDFRRSIEGLLAKLDHGLATQEWAAQSGTHCQICPASSECPIPPHLRDVKTIGTEDDAREVSERILARDRDQKTDKASLKSWVDENGDLVVGDEAWTFTLTRSERANKDEIKALISEHGLDIADYFTEAESTRFGRQEVKVDG